MNEIITGNTATTTTEDPPTTTTGKSKKQITTFDSIIKNSNFDSTSKFFFIINIAKYDHQIL